MSASTTTPGATPLPPQMVTPSPPSRDGRYASSSRLGARSTSPGGRQALASRMQRTASDIRRSAGALHAQNDVSAAQHQSIAEQSAMDCQASVEAFISSVPVRLEMLTEKVVDVQRKRESDRRLFDRRFQQLDSKVDVYLEDRAKDAEKRTKWAEVQGSVTGLLEELHTVTRRVDDLDQRMMARTNGFDAVRQRCQELDQQVQSLEQHSRQSNSTKEEVHKRQAQRLLRAEKHVEEFARRLSKAEDELQTHPREQFNVAQMRNVYMKELDELRQRLEWLEAPGVQTTITDHWEELRTRVEWLEETNASVPVPKPQHGRDMAQAQDAICHLTEQLNRLLQRSSCGEQALETLKQQVQQMFAGEQDRNHIGHDGALARNVSTLQLQLVEVSRQVADVVARMMDAETRLEQLPDMDTRQDIDGFHGNDVSTANHDDTPGPREAWPPQFEEVVNDVATIKNWVMALEQQGALPLQSGPQASARLPESDNEASGLRQSEELPRESDAGDMTRYYDDELSKCISYCMESSARMEKFEESIDLYWSYTTSVASDHQEQLQSLSMHLQDVDKGFEAVKQVLHGQVDDGRNQVEVAHIQTQVDDVRNQVAELNARGLPCSEGEVLLERLVAVEGRLDATASQHNKIKTMVSENLGNHRQELEETKSFVSENLGNHRQELEETKASVGALLDHVHDLERRVHQPQNNFGNVSCPTLSKLCANFKEKTDWLQTMDQEDLADVEEALLQMQSICYSAANDIASAVQLQLHSLQCGEDGLMSQHELDHFKRAPFAESVHHVSNQGCRIIRDDDDDDDQSSSDASGSAEGLPEEVVIS